MRIKTAVRNSCLIVATTAAIFAIGLIVAELNYGETSHHVEAVTALSQCNTQDSASLDYHVWRVFSEDRKGFTIVVVSVSPTHFNRNDMTMLAARLNKEFGERKKLKIGLLDDENIARNFVSGRAEYSTYEIAERGRYYLDRSTCKEYIQFSTLRGRPRETVNIECSTL